MGLKILLHELSSKGWSIGFIKQTDARVVPILQLRGSLQIRSRIEYIITDNSIVLSYFYFCSG